LEDTKLNATDGRTDRQTEFIYQYRASVYIISFAHTCSMLTRDKICIFCPGQISRADRRKNLHDGRALSWVSPLLVAISLGISKWGGANLFFWTVCLRRSFGDLRDIQLSTHECRLAVPFMSGHRLLRLHGIVVVVVGSRAISSRRWSEITPKW